MTNEVLCSLNFLGTTCWNWGYIVSDPYSIVRKCCMAYDDTNFMGDQYR